MKYKTVKYVLLILAITLSQAIPAVESNVSKDVPLVLGFEVESKRVNRVLLSNTLNIAVGCLGYIGNFPIARILQPRQVITIIIPSEVREYVPVNVYVCFNNIGEYEAALKRIQLNVI